MSVQILVDKYDYNQEQEVTINGETYYFRFRYNTSVTDNPWFLDILDNSKEYLLASRRVIHGEVSTYSSIRETFNGVILCVNTLFDGSPVTEETFHSDGKHIIAYVSYEELRDAIST